MDFHTLFNNLKEYFTIEELQELCFLLEINHQQIAYRPTLDEFARKLIEYCDHRNILPELIDICRQKRPRLIWPHASLYISPSSYKLDRPQELNAIHNILQKNQIAILIGMAGIGKTQLTIDYAKHYKNYYRDGIFQTSANISITHGLAKLGKRLNPRATEQSEQGQFATSLKYLRRGSLDPEPQQLMIVNDLATLAELTIPIKGHQFVLLDLPCKILVTTDTASEVNYPKLDIPRLTPDQALDFFLRYLGRSLDPSKKEDIEEYIAAQQLCSLLGHLPLAIKLVANELTNQSIADYRKNFGGTDLGLTRRINKILESHWNILKQSNADAHDILSYVGQFKSDTISLEQLELLSGLSTEQFQEALEIIQKVSLIENVTLNHLEVHPLVRQFARHQFTGRTQRILRLLMQEEAINTIDEAKKADNYLDKLIIAGECLFELTWIATNLRLKVLDELSHILTDQNLSGTELRKILILRMRIHWLVESSSLSPDEMLTSLDPIVRLANSPIDREALIRDIDKLLTLNISAGQKFRFHLYQAQLFAQLYEFLEPDVKQSEDGRTLIQKAQNSIEKAYRAVKRADDGLRDQQLWAQIYHFSANIGSLQAELIRKPDKRRKALQTTLSVYIKAKKAVEQIRHDPLLTVGIYSEMAKTFASLMSFVKAEKHYDLAMETLNHNEKIVCDDEVFVLKKAHILIKHGYMCWFKAKTKKLEEFAPDDCLEYVRAFEYTKEAIDLLQSYVSGTGNLAIAYLNAGDYLFELKQANICKEMVIDEDPVSYWRKAQEFSERYGYWDVLQHVKQAMAQMEQ